MICPPMEAHPPPQAPADPGRPAARREERAGPCEPLAAAAALGEDRWGERQRPVRLSARPQPRRGGSPSSPPCAPRSRPGNHGVQRGRRRRQRRGGGEGERQEEEEAGRPGHDMAHLLQRRHDRRVIHCAVGIVRTSVLVTGVQVSSRIFMVWFIAHSIKQIQNEESVILFLVVWTVTEITRYSFYTFNLLNHLPYFIKWARYNFFIVLYPAGVAGELLTIYAALPYVKKTGMFSLRLPNKYNVSFDYYYFLIIVMFSYVPLFPQLYFHMLRQRRRVLHGEVIVEKDD
ncbi:very-long-chain (3R)-3-hydroxyacyl-CoA dehydratase 1 isoform X5 [Haemorhous mexicanus]|uniref:very-long-chain (3R)-3-hydroxyacyl-CoA dehydratase 1 isoform X5 n=2 Tax=Haemorhous mexicanus TaxID=30427 RepID=UPI0028BE366A|nr:very-long-chain (3R)-3-hydroxyacyl-CoA dehydratase 1 isoform X5 [Haemorhous mexicanus]